MMSEHLEMHYKLMDSKRWRVDRSQANHGMVYYYPIGTSRSVRMLLEEAYEMENFIQKAIAKATPTTSSAE